jgi:hypothetical protein
MKKQNKIADINFPNGHRRLTEKESTIKNQKRMDKQLINMPARKQTDQPSEKYKQTINQLPPFGGSCSANSGVGLSHSQSQAGISHLPSECPGAATITNYFLPKSSPRDALGTHYQLCITYSGPIDKISFAKASCLASVVWLRIWPGNNTEGLPMI